MDQETRTSNQDARLKIVFEMAQVLSTLQPLEVILPKFLSCLIERWEAADTGLLLLWDSAEEKLRVAAAHGYDLDRVQRLRLAPGESISGQSFQTGQTTLYTTPQEIAGVRNRMSASNFKIFQAATIGVRHPLSAICLPLATNSVKLGVLVLQNVRKPGRFGPEDVTFLQSVAEVIGLAIYAAQKQMDSQTIRTFDGVDLQKAELISTLAHEMRTPLTSIKGYTTALLMEEADFSLDAQQEFLELIDRECDTLQDLIHDMLESSNIDAGLLRLEIQPLMLDRLAKIVADETKRNSSNHRFLVDFPRDFPILDADPDRIAQVLRNLIDNAIKYSPDGGLIIVRGEVQAHEVIISVADQGIGISPEDLNRLFEKFFRAKSVPGHHVVGSGLGLPISRTIVEAHGGRIWAKSKVDQGTTLFFALPLRDELQEPVNYQERT